MLGFLIPRTTAVACCSLSQNVTYCSGDILVEPLKGIEHLLEGRLFVCECFAVTEEPLAPRIVFDRHHDSAITVGGQYKRSWPTRTPGLSTDIWH